MSMKKEVTLILKIENPRLKKKKELLQSLSQKFASYSNKNFNKTSAVNFKEKVGKIPILSNESYNFGCKSLRKIGPDGDNLSI